MNTSNYNVKEPSKITQFLWWCAGADAYFLKQSPMQDRVKYAGIGGIILCTGLLAGVSGSFAFYTIFGPKGDAIDTSLTASIGIQIGTALFAIIWGLIIFNLDRFIVSSTGKGDGTDVITGKEFLQAIPRIIIGLILGFAISSPLEIKILESEINSELSIFQNKYAQDLNMQSDTMFNQKKADLENKKAEYESKLAKYETELKVYSDQVDDLVARQQTEMQDKRAYGFGPVAKKMQADIETKRTERDKFIQNKLGDVSAWRKQLEVINTQINNLSDDLRKAYKANEEKSHGYDGLLKRIEISHEKGGMVPWVILLVFLCIEMGPIFFKMMMTKGVYDFMVENHNHKKQVENGVYREDYVYEGANGVIHMEKWRYLDVESAKHEKEKKVAEQNKINELIIDEWSKITMDDVKQDPKKYFTEGNNSIENNNA
jgi:hypothetical protein